MRWSQLAFSAHPWPLPRTLTIAALAELGLIVEANIPPFEVYDIADNLL